jgi:hypothetical protein
VPSHGSKEELSGGTGLDAGRGELLAVGRQRERRDGVDVLGGKVKRLAAGCQDRQRRAVSEQLSDERCRVEHVLEVVEHQEQFLAFEQS